MTDNSSRVPDSLLSRRICQLVRLDPGAHVGIVLRNRPGPLAVLIATLGTGREVVTLSPHLGDIGLEQDIIDLAPDVLVAEDEDWARDAVLASAKAVGAIALRTGLHRTRRCGTRATSRC